MPQRLGNTEIPFSHFTLALAFLQLVQALGVTESGTLRLLPVAPEVSGLTWPDNVVSELAAFDGGDTDSFDGGDTDV